jgi:hypothetical protein
MGTHVRGRTCVRWRYSRRFASSAARALPLSTVRYRWRLRVGASPSCEPSWLSSVSGARCRSRSRAA